MKFPRGKRAVLPLLGALVVVAVAFGFWRNSQPWIPEGWTAPLTPPPAYAQTGDTALTGWAWSSNIGWVSFNCANIATANCGSPGGTPDFKVSMDALGNLSGYAWSNNIGWIDFAPAGAQSPGTAKLMDGKLVGWIRAIAADSSASAGWDGWISLSGTIPPPTGGSYGVELNQDGKSLNGFAWGSTVVGWLKFGLNLANNPSDCVDEVCLPGGGGETLSCVSPTATAGQLTWNASIASGSWDFTWTNGEGQSSLGAQNSTQSATTTTGVAGRAYNMTVTAIDNVRGAANTKTAVCPPVNIPGQRNLHVTVVYDGVSSGKVNGAAPTPFTAISNCIPGGGVCDQPSVNFGQTGDLVVSENPAGSTITSDVANCNGTVCTVTIPTSGAGVYDVTITISAAPADFDILLTNCYPNPVGAPSATDCIIKIDDSGGSPTSTVGKIQITPSGASPVTVTLTGEINQGSNSVLIRPHTDVNPCDPNNVTSECTGYFYYFLPGLNDRVEAVRSVPLGGSTISFITTIGVNYDIPIGQYYYPITIRAQSSTGGPKTATGWLLFINNSGSGQTP